VKSLLVTGLSLPGVTTGGQPGHRRSAATLRSPARRRTRFHQRPSGAARTGDSTPRIIKDRGNESYRAWRPRARTGLYKEGNGRAERTGPPTRSPGSKLRIVAEYDAALKNEKGAILRRERLYHSHVKEWPAARDAGALEKLVDKRTSPAKPKKSAAEAENEKLRRQVERLEKKLARNKAALDVMGKTSALLEMISEGAD
jgi:hypothetical protein